MVLITCEKCIVIIFIIVVNIIILHVVGFILTNIDIIIFCILGDNR